jgi:hypothetical protein
MIPLSSATSGGLIWSKISSRSFELNRSGEVIGRLQRPSFWSCSFQAETQTGRWTFRRSGWLGGCSDILDSASPQPIATFKPAWGGRGGKLTFVDGQTFQLQCKGWWRPVWSVIAESDEVVLRLQRREKTVEMSSAPTVPESRSGLLILFTWYHVLQSEEEAASAAVIAAS